MVWAVAEAINHCHGGRVESGAHAFGGASDVENRELSKKKAGVVRDFLLTLVADPSRLVAVGYGDAFPRVQGSSVHAARFNQRVEFSPLKQ